jgi:nitrate/TMAO reductase-like tetraheme cytochrome c subunit
VTFDRKLALQRVAWFFGATTLLNILIGTQVTYRAVEHMETPQFCGGTCHTMNPELAAYQNSPHSRVECVECHVAPGAAGWISSKTNGIRQLVETVLNTYPRPIPSALESNRLVPATETCENCHWQQKFGGVRLRVFSKYADDDVSPQLEMEKAFVR